MATFFPFVLITILPFVGCTGQPEGLEDNSEVVGDAQHRINILNALSPEALVVGGDFAKGPLSLGGMAASARAAIEDPSEDGDLARSFLRYAVGCALGPDQDISFFWTDELGRVHDETYRGAVGLAESWAKGSLDEAGQQWVSACLGARTNRHSRVVEISMRGSADALAGTDDVEIETFAYEEGAFWGNVFVPEPYLRTCYDPANVDRSRTKARDCAAGAEAPDGERIGCGIIEITGACADQCDALVGADRYHPGCAVPESGVPSGGKTEYVITVFLP